MSVEVMTPQFDPDKGETPSELAALRALALDHHKSVLAAREIVRCRNAYMGRLYEGDTVLPWKPTAVHPKVHEVVERFVSVLTDSRVKFEPRPRNDEDKLLADALIAAADYEWERQRMDLLMQVASRGVLTDGTTMLYTCMDDYDITANPRTRIFSPFAFVPDPCATSDDDMAYCFIRFGMTRNEIEKKWPEHAQIIFDRVHHGTAPLRDENTFNSGGVSYPQVGQSGTLTNTAGVSVDMEFSTPQTPQSGQGKRYRVEEWWFQKGEDRELTVNLADGDTQIVQMPSTKGRRMYVIEGHFFPELDGPNPFDHGTIPVSSLRSIALMGEYLALPYIQPLLDTAEQLADIDNQIMANVRLMMHPVWMVPRESRIDLTKFFSAPGMVLPYRHPYKPEAHTPPALPQYVFELRQIKNAEFNDAGGINDISRGNFSGGLDDVSGKAVALLQRPTYTRMRPIQLSTEYAITRWGYQTMCNAMQFWPEERWRKVLPAEIADMPLPWLEERIGMDGMPMPRESVDKYLPEIRMAAGSNLPENQDQKNSLVFNLYDRQGFGIPGSPTAVKELLDGVKYPNADRIAAEVEQAMLAQQQQQAMMMGAQPGQPAPPPPGGANKALGGERSPADDQSVMAGMSGQEEGL